MTLRREDVLGELLFLGTPHLSSSVSPTGARLTVGSTQVSVSVSVSVSGGGDRRQPDSTDSSSARASSQNLVRSPR